MSSRTTSVSSTTSPEAGFAEAALSVASLGNPASYARFERTLQQEVDQFTLRVSDLVLDIKTARLSPDLLEVFFERAFLAGREFRKGIEEVRGAAIGDAGRYEVVDVVSKMVFHDAMKAITDSYNIEDRGAGASGTTVFGLLHRLTKALNGGGNVVAIQKAAKLAEISAHGSLAAHMVRDILDGRLDPWCPWKLVDEFVAELAETRALKEAASRGVQLEVELHKCRALALPQVFQTLRVSVLPELVRNAVDAGATRVALEIRRTADGWTLMVTDNGEAIKKSDLPRLFEEGFSTKNARGRGMGLFLIKSVIEELGGRIGCIPLGKEGKSFWFSLPEKGTVPGRTVAMSAEIRRVSEIQDLTKVEELQKTIWGLPELEVVPAASLVSVMKTGGAVLAAFDATGEVCGFAVALPAWDRERLEPYWHLDLLGVRPELQSQSIGTKLLAALRHEAVIEGLRRIDLTFDPLDTRNAKLYLSKVAGQVVDCLPNLYGSWGGELTESLPTDRFLARWDLTKFPHPPVQGAMPQAVSEEFKLRRDVLEQGHPIVAIRVPHDFRELKEADLKTAAALQGAVREAASYLLEKGYRGIGFRMSGDGKAGEYLFER